MMYLCAVKTSLKRAPDRLFRNPVIGWSAALARTVPNDTGSRTFARKGHRSELEAEIQRLHSAIDCAGPATFERENGLLFQ